MIITLNRCEDVLFEAGRAIKQFRREPVLFKLTAGNYTKTLKHITIGDKEFCVRYTLTKNIICNFTGLIKEEKVIEPSKPQWLINILGKGEAK